MSYLCTFGNRFVYIPDAHLAVNLGPALKMFQQATKFAPRDLSSFEMARDAGYEAAEFWTGPKLIRDADAVIELAKVFDLNYAVHFPNRGSFEENDLAGIVRIYNELDCSAMVVHQPMFDEWSEELLSIDGNLRLGVENHFLENERDLTEWAEESPYLTLDVEHLWIFTQKDSSLKRLLQSVDALLDKYGEKLIHIHLPGYLPGYKEHRPQYCSRSMVLKVFSMLADYGYDGMVVSEIANRYQNPEELMMDRLLFRRWKRKRQESKDGSLEIVG